MLSRNPDSPVSSGAPGAIHTSVPTNMQISPVEQGGKNTASLHLSGTTARVSSTSGIISGFRHNLGRLDSNDVPPPYSGHSASS